MMRRRYAPIVVLSVLVGMAVTVLVAWACVLFSERDRWRRDDPAAAAEWAAWAPAAWPTWAELGEAERAQSTKRADGTYGPGVHREIQSDGGVGVSERAQFATRFFDVEANAGVPAAALFDKYETHRTEAGWPLAALRVEWMYEYLGAPRGVRTPAPRLVPAPGLLGGLSIPDAIGRVADDDAERLPAWPVWAGFIGNTVVYGAGVFVLIAGLGWIRRGLRRGRGACVGCGYSLAGSRGGVCPECGAGV